MTREPGFRPAGYLRPRIRFAAYCNGCGATIQRGYQYCGPCAKGLRISAAVQAMSAAYDEARSCSRCAAALCTTGPDVYTLCSTCREVSV